MKRIVLLAAMAAVLGCGEEEDGPCDSSAERSEDVMISGEAYCVTHAELYETGFCTNSPEGISYCGCGPGWTCVADWTPDPTSEWGITSDYVCVPEEEAAADCY